MTFEKKENSVWPGFPKNNPSVTDTVYVLITGGGWGALTDPSSVFMCCWNPVIF